MTWTNEAGLPASQSDIFYIIDGRPDKACSDGQVTGDPKCVELRGDPVNTLTGAFVYADQDFSMPVRGGSLDVWRSYDSRLTSSVAMGSGWTYAYSDSLTVQAG